MTDDFFIEKLCGEANVIVDKSRTGFSSIRDGGFASYDVTSDEAHLDGYFGADELRAMQALMRKLRSMHKAKKP